MISFLTKLPIPRFEVDKKAMGESAVYFPLAGLLIGLLLSLSNIILSPIFSQAIVNLILVLVMIFITGGIHLDGLADTIDGLASKETSKEKILSIMRDSRVGVMGVIAIVAAILFKFLLLNDISPLYKNSALIIMAVVSRWSMTLCINTSSYARPEGLGKIFLENRSFKGFILSSILALVILSFVAFPKSFVIFFEIAVFTMFFNWYIKSKIGGITGDTLGAINEINEIITLGIFTVLC